VVLCTLILTGGDLRMFLDVHAAIVISAALSQPL
jgi:flagellar motor component MotA